MEIATRKENGQTIITATAGTGELLGQEVCFSNHPMTIYNFEEKLRQRWQHFDGAIDLGSLHPIDCGFDPKKLGQVVTIDYHNLPVKIKTGPTKTAPNGKVLVAGNSRGLASMLRENGYMVAGYDRDAQGQPLPTKKYANGWLGGGAEIK